MSAGTSTEPAARSGSPDATRRRPWLAWLVGGALLAAVIAAAFHLAEARDFARMAESAEPWWLVAALLLQGFTYIAAARVLRTVARTAGRALPLGAACRLSLVKLFVDQAVPSAGLSGTVVLASGLRRLGVPRAVVASTLVVSLASHYTVYVIGLALAVVIVSLRGQASAALVAVSAAFGVASLAICAGTLLLAGRPMTRVPGRLARLRPIRTALELVEQADPLVARDPRILLAASAWQAAIVACDALTVWVLVRALGAHAPPSGIFASFMIASLLRTVGFAPGGLGTFEAASALTLRAVGVPTAVALGATLLFRGLSFWLPMLPGLWLSRREMAAPPEEAALLPQAWWRLEAADLAGRLGSTERGLSSAEATDRLGRFGRNELATERPMTRARLLWRQVKSPLLLLLLVAAAISAATGESTDALIVSVIVVATVGIGYERERSARAAAAALRTRVRTRATALRDGAAKEIVAEEIVPGDVILLSAGSIVAADAVVVESANLQVNESVLTGESFPAEKRTGTSPADAPLRKRENCVFLGTHVESGTARAMVVATGARSEVAAIAHRLAEPAPETEFDRGIRRFGTLLTAFMLLMVTLVFVVHVLDGRAAIETLLFAIALAVGLSPELLPAILTVNLARGARLMATHGVLVRRLNAIENLGSMDVLCTDKTGTLTEGVVRLESALDAAGAASPSVLELAAVNASLQGRTSNPLDDAILAARIPDLAGLRKTGEIPFDFVRKRVAVIVEGPDGARMIVKGAFRHVLEACTRLPDGAPLDERARAGLERLHERWTGEGLRVLAVAARDVPAGRAASRESEADLALAGFLTFLDRPKADAAEAIGKLARLGVTVKLITGDSGLVARHVAGLVGLPSRRVLTGEQVDAIAREALPAAADATDLFVEVDPGQKERILLALKKAGHVVAFLGDGVNDAPAMHAADTSLSVEEAVDVAREAADFVLLERDLDVIRAGIEEGRRTFANTLKYVLTTTSANLGNMVSMAVASLFLPFLPLLAGQILLNNFISDIPAVGIADDGVDEELLARPRRWDMRFIGRFMVEFGLLSSLFDVLTFAVLLGLVHAGPETFRTGWFVESLLTELVIALVVRTRRPFFRSRPGRLLLVTTAVLVPASLAIPYIPGAGVLGFVPLPFGVLAMLVAITLLYMVAAEATKAWFYRSDDRASGARRGARA